MTAAVEYIIIIIIIKNDMKGIRKRYYKIVVRNIERNIIRI